MKRLVSVGDNGFGTAQARRDVRFIGSTSGRLGSTGALIDRNGFDFPSIHRLDVRLQRRFAVSGRLKIDGIFEMFNVFNRANYARAVRVERSQREVRPAEYEYDARVCAAYAAARIPDFVLAWPGTASTQRRRDADEGGDSRCTRFAECSTPLLAGRHFRRSTACAFVFFAWSERQ